MNRLVKSSLYLSIVMCCSFIPAENAIKGHAGSIKSLGVKKVKTQVTLTAINLTPWQWVIQLKNSVTGAQTGFLASCYPWGPNETSISIDSNAYDRISIVPNTTATPANPYVADFRWPAPLWYPNTAGGWRVLDEVFSCPEDGTLDIVAHPGS